MECAKRSHITLSLLLLWLASTGLFAQPHLYFAGTERSVLSDISEHILIEAYASIGIEVSRLDAPNSRSLQLSVDGVSDGQLNRKGGLSQNYPELIQIPVPIQRIEVYIFTHTLTPHIRDWQSLLPYTIAYPRGVLYYEEKLKGFNTIALNNYQQVFQFLDKGRADFAVASYASGITTINAYQLTQARPLAKIDEIPLYHYLHVRHRELVPAITRALQTMQDNGRIDAISQQFKELAVEEELAKN